jgi:NodT family efflux transporter outer membrane factor (OMF) lipoprotein
MSNRMINFASQFQLHLVLACGFVTLSACTTLGPDYQEPEVSWLQQWQPSAYAASGNQRVQKQVDLRFWWKLFNDPALNKLIDVAREENLPLRIAGLRIFESLALLGIAGSSLYPQLQQAGGAINYVDTRYHGGDAPPENQSFGSYQAGFNMAWELDFWGRFRRGIESADAAYLASVANQQDMQVLISAQVADVYYAYRTTQARISIAKENAAIQKRSFEITTELFKNGETSELDLQQAKTQYLATLSTIPQLEITLAQTRNALTALLGRPPGKIPELAASRYKLPAIRSSTIGKIPAYLLTRRPDIRAAAWRIAAQSAQIGIAETDYYPAITLLGTLGWSGNSLGGTPNTSNLVIGPAVLWNIFDYGRIKNNVRLQDARLQQLIEQYQESVLQAAREVDDAATGIRKTREQQTLSDAAVKSSQRALEIANTRYREGYADFQRVLEAQRALATRAEAQLLNRGSHIASVISLYKSLGGGWIDMPAEQLIPPQVRETMQNRTNWGDLLTSPKPDKKPPISAKETSPDE